MRFTEHELTAALHGAAKAMVAAQRKDIRKGKADIDTVWESMGRYERFKLLDVLGDQILPVLVALPDVAVESGTRPAFTDAQIAEAVESRMDDSQGKLRRKVMVAARIGLVRAALAHVPPRTDPDALTVPDHL
jgi:hypothetical protein